LLVVLVGVGAVGSMVLGAESAVPASRVASVYAPLILTECGLLAYVCRLRSPILRGLVGPSRGVLPFALDLGLGVVLAVALELAEHAIGPHGTMHAIPTTRLERGAWIAVAVSAGFCEEVVYRGYLRVQLSAFSGSRALGNALQAALFGIAHLDQGGPMASRLALYGALFGMVAIWRQSLVACIVAHVVVDLMAAA
jgi:membrane protease YdiL (CAAX protease family)